MLATSLRMLINNKEGACKGVALLMGDNHNIILAACCMFPNFMLETVIPDAKRPKLSHLLKIIRSPKFSIECFERWIDVMACVSPKCLLMVNLCSVVN